MPYFNEDGTFTERGKTIALYTAEQLRRKVEQVMSLFPWYRHKLSSTMTIDQLPLMTADVLNHAYYGQTPKQDLHVYRTSGTGSGQRKAICYSDADEQQYRELKKQVFSHLLSSTDYTRVVSDVGTGHAASTANRIFTELGMQCRTISFDRPIQEHLALLAQFRPEVLYTMPSILDRILQAASDPTAYGIKKIILVGEIASKKWQKQVAKTLGLEPHDLIDTYGSIEIGTIAYYSHTHHRYILIDGLFGECVQPEAVGLRDTTLRADESILVLTSWVREQFPALRFVTYDVVRDFRVIDIDGQRRQTFQAIVKRVGNEWKHGEKISLYDIEEVVYQFVDQVRMKVSVVDNVLNVTLFGRNLAADVAKEIGEAIEQKIPEIGSMVQGGLLQNVRVMIDASNEETEADRTTIKGKKLY